MEAEVTDTHVEPRRHPTREGFNRELRQIQAAIVEIGSYVEVAPYDEVNWGAQSARCRPRNDHRKTAEGGGDRGRVGAGESS
jgi:hypothetical protein